MKKGLVLIGVVSTFPMHAGYGDFLKRIFRCGSSRQEINLDRKGLAADMQRYTTTHEGHAGSPFAHSLYAARVIAQWFEENSLWVEGVSRVDRRALLLAACLHDIGKCGDGQLVFDKKPEHPALSFDLLTGRRKYRISENEAIDMRQWLDQEPGLTARQRALIKVLAGIHWDFGPVVDGKKSATSFLLKLQRLAISAGYNKGELDREIVCAAILINAADVKAIQPCEHPVPELQKYRVLHERPGWDCWTRWEYATKGMAARQTVLALLGAAGVGPLSK